MVDVAPALVESTATTGERLARAIATGDRATLLGLLAPDLDFKAVTPGRLWQSTTSAEVVETILGTWFGGDRRIDGIDGIVSDQVADREHVAYRFSATTADGGAVIEQQAYLGVDDGVVTSLHVLCSGYRPQAGATGGAAGSS